MNLYMIVTNDKYELPCAVDLNIHEVANFIGTTLGTAKNMVYRPRKNAKYKVLISRKMCRQRQKLENRKRYDKTRDRSEYFRERYKRMKERKQISCGPCRQI